MSDFGDIEFFDNLSEMPSGVPLAPEGEHNAKIIATEKYKSRAGNWTLQVTFQIDGGKYKDHNEWYNLWSTDEKNKRISTEMFTRLTKACGLKKYPEEHGHFVGKNLTLDMYQKQDSFKGDSGEEIKMMKTKIKNYLLAVDSDNRPPPEAVPPF